MCRRGSDETVSLCVISGNLSSELRIVLDDVLELQRVFLNTHAGTSRTIEDVVVAQKFDFVEQGIRDIRKILDNVCSSYESATTQALKKRRAATSFPSSSRKHSPECENTHTLRPSNWKPSQPRFDTSLLVADLQLGRIKERFICRSASSYDKRGIDEVDWL